MKERDAATLEANRSVHDAEAWSGIRLPGAHAANIPTVVRPQLATITAMPPEGDHWLHEIKFDGYRTVAFIDRGGVRLITRGGHDWTGYYGRLANAFRDLECQRAVLDGEVAAQDEAGITNIVALEDALSRRRTESLVYYAFDVIYLNGYDLTYLNGYDLTRVRLIDRKEAHCWVRLTRIPDCASANT
jgi:ATP-dependent DNA ligase